MSTESKPDFNVVAAAAFFFKKIKNKMETKFIHHTIVYTSGESKYILNHTHTNTHWNFISKFIHTVLSFKSISKHTENPECGLYTVVYMVFG